MTQHAEVNAPIVFFDGTCGMCSGTVRWLLKHDHTGSLRFAPIQGETFESLEHPDKPEGLKTMVVLDEGELYLFSDSSLRMLWHLGGVWRVLARLGGLVPRMVRDPVYRFIAAHRYRIAGRVERCEVPTEADRARMLP